LRVSRVISSATQRRSATGGHCKKMRKSSGTLLVLAGVSVVTYVWSGKNTGASPPKIAADASLRAPTSAAQTPAEDAAAAPVALPPSATTAVIPSKVLNIADAAPRIAYPLSAGYPLDRARLTREIQFQLKRAGCYRGTIDGVWSATVRRFMKVFTDRVNATLSVEQPDIVLLAMLQSHQGIGCAVPCRVWPSMAAVCRMASSPRSRKSRRRLARSLPRRLRRPSARRSPLDNRRARRSACAAHHRRLARRLPAVFRAGPRAFESRWSVTACSQHDRGGLRVRSRFDCGRRSDEIADMVEIVAERIRQCYAARSNLAGYMWLCKSIVRRQ
jgi:hypothetical protein